MEIWPLLALGKDAPANKSSSSSREKSSAKVPLTVFLLFERGSRGLLGTLFFLVLLL